MKKPRASSYTSGSIRRTSGREVSVTFKAARMIAVTGAEGGGQRAEGRRQRAEGRGVQRGRPERSCPFGVTHPPGFRVTYPAGFGVKKCRAARWPRELGPR